MFRLFRLVSVFRQKTEPKQNRNVSVVHYKVSVASVTKAQQNASILWAKAVELQQVIDESMKCFKAFFKWLYVEILRLSEENVSEELSKTTQQDVQFIADFLSSLSSVSSSVDSYSYLEKVGQYLKREKLPQPIGQVSHQHKLSKKWPLGGFAVKRIGCFDCQLFAVHTFDF